MLFWNFGLTEKIVCPWVPVSTFFAKAYLVGALALLFPVESVTCFFFDLPDEFVLCGVPFFISAVVFLAIANRLASEVLKLYNCDGICSWLGTLFVECPENCPESPDLLELPVPPWFGKPFGSINGVFCGQSWSDAPLSELVGFKIDPAFIFTASTLFEFGSLFLPLLELAFITKFWVPRADPFPPLLSVTTDRADWIRPVLS